MLSMQSVVRPYLGKKMAHKKRMVHKKDRDSAALVSANISSLSPETKGNAKESLDNVPAYMEQ